MAPRRRSSHPFGVSAVRTWLPALLVVAAGVVLIVGPRGLAPGLLLTAMFVIVADWIIRIAITSQDDRDDEAAARRRFARSGRWPEQDDDGTEAERDGAAASTHDAPHRTGSPHEDRPAHRPPARRGPRRR